MTSTPLTHRRLVIVSNRLPFVVTQSQDSLVFTESDGGLATGLRTYLDSLETGSGSFGEYLWVGWPGSTVDPARQEEVIATARDAFHAVPVFLAQEEMEQFYHGFCNSTIWPLFHYFTAYSMFDETQWEQYIRVNEIFCKAVNGILRDGDVVWIHDYHLMLLPGMVRASVPDVPIGFFLHIPFPTFEVFRLLPNSWRRQILSGLLGADLVAFHTYGYMQYFLQCTLRLLGHEHHLGQILLPDRVVRVETLPMGIHFSKFNHALDDPGVRQEQGVLASLLPGVKVVLSVDRLDYTKGVLNRLQGFEVLLEGDPSLHGNVVMIMIVVPSRTGVSHYDHMKRQIEELVGKINGKFGRIGWTPILYQYKHMSFGPLVALYSVSDVALVTPLRDGMNLVAKEYVASRNDLTGVLIISEMAGAAKELGEAITINPHTTLEIAQALREALAMPVEEQRRRNQIMQNRLRRYDVLRWANDFVHLLFATREAQDTFASRLLIEGAHDTLLKSYSTSHHRLILLDYDGTLVPFAPDPQESRPDRDLIGLLEALAADLRNTLVLVSGRDRGTLEEWFGTIPMHLVAEHGTWIKEYAGAWELLKPLPREWKERIFPILEHYADRLPGSRIEEKEYSVVWHYRNAHPEQAQLLAGELTDHLVAFTANIDVQILQGKKVIEVRNAGIHKGVAARHWMAKEEYEFVLGIGDDWTDEDLFKVLPPTAYSIKVGIANSHARYNLGGIDEVHDLLRALAAQPRDPRAQGDPKRSARKMKDGHQPVRRPQRRNGTVVAWLLGFGLYPVVRRLWTDRIPRGPQAKVEPQDDIPNRDVGTPEHTGQ
ncbi:MAG: bifunctional alpha,alpha-trehalose-phosphate synthase (UDP-forming)/trehalose-phosphatase [Ignavibacteriae bacterium]|nr:bifunctional alpha,alpha-trehalose-phosphate synthase (UDP-forming)/trehalose-phosphatase [Ignavibacteriota bacterium]